jgi:hypothetical protein
MKQLARKVVTYLTDGMKAKNMAGYDRNYLIKRIKGGVQ